MEITRKEEFKKVVDSLISSKNDLLDEVYGLNCSLLFINEATSTLMINDNSNIMEEVSYFFSNQVNGLRDKLINLINQFESKLERTVDNLYSFLEEDKK